MSAPGGPGLDRLPFAVRSLSIGDLPTNLWWASPQPPPLAGNLLYDLGEHAQQIMYDSLGWPDPRAWCGGDGDLVGECGAFHRCGPLASGVGPELAAAKVLAAAGDTGDWTRPVDVATITEVAVSRRPTRRRAGVGAVKLRLAARLGWKLQAGKVDPERRDGLAVSSTAGQQKLFPHQAARSPVRQRSRV